MEKEKAIRDAKKAEKAMTNALLSKATPTIHF